MLWSGGYATTRWLAKHEATVQRASARACNGRIRTPLISAFFFNFSHVSYHLGALQLELCDLSFWASVHCCVVSFSLAVEIREDGGKYSPGRPSGLPAAEILPRTDCASRTVSQIFCCCKHALWLFPLLLVGCLGSRTWTGEQSLTRRMISSNENCFIIFTGKLG